MDINDIILTDEALKVIDEGTWVSDISGLPGVELLITGLRGQDAQKNLAKKQTELRMKNKGKPLSDEQLAQAMRETLAENVLKGWKGFTSGGKAVDYSPELARKWLLSRNGEKFAGIVLAAAQRVDDQANDFVGEVVKN